MDPLSAALLTALGAAIEKRVGGAAAEYLLDAAKHQAERLRGLLPSDEAKQAQAILTHVLAEAAAFPPTTAITVEPLATMGTVGVWSPRGTLALDLLWSNRADFPVRVRDLKVTGRVGSAHPEWTISHGDEFTLRPRSDTHRIVRGEPSLDLPPFERGGVGCDITVHALVAGPWEHSAQRTHSLYSGSVWVPVYLEQQNLLSEPADIDIALDHQLWLWTRKGYETYKVQYSELDRMLGLRAGSSKERLGNIAQKRRHKVRAGSTIALIKFDYSGDGYPDGFAG